MGTQRKAPFWGHFKCQVLARRFSSHRRSRCRRSIPLFNKCSAETEASGTRSAGVREALSQVWLYLLAVNILRVMRLKQNSPEFLVMPYS